MSVSNGIPAARAMEAPADRSTHRSSGLTPITTSLPSCRHFAICWTTASDVDQAGGSSALTAKEAKKLINTRHARWMSLFPILRCEYRSEPDILDGPPDVDLQRQSAPEPNLNKRFRQPNVNQITVRDLSRQRAA